MLTYPRFHKPAHNDLMEDDALDHELAIALEIRRAKLRAYADALLEATITLPMPKTHLDAERAAKSVIATDRMLVVVFSKPTKPAYREPKPTTSYPSPKTSYASPKSKLHATPSYPPDEAAEASCEDIDFDTYFDELESNDDQGDAPSDPLDEAGKEKIAAQIFETYLKSISEPIQPPLEIKSVERAIHHGLSP